MASNRIGRINEEIQRELAELIRSLKDPRVQTMISIRAWIPHRICATVKFMSACSRRQGRRMRSAG